MASQLALAIATFLFAYILLRIANSLRAALALWSLPASHVPFQPFALPGAAIPTFGWHAGLNVTWRWRGYLYSKNETCSIIPFLSGIPVVYTSNIDVVRQVVAGGYKSNFIKPEALHRGIITWGMNLVASDGEVWRKHRRVMGPAFNIKTYQLVWEKTAQSCYEMIDCEGWDRAKFVDVPVVQNLTLKLALLILTSCGLGIPSHWETPPEKTDDTEMTLWEALSILMGAIMFTISAPNWTYKLPIKWIKNINKANALVGQYMYTQIAQRKSGQRLVEEIGEVSNMRTDVLSSLLDSNETEGKLHLDESELLGNMYLMLIAGHETTASTLGASLALMALHQDIQGEVLEQIISVVGYGREPAFQDYSKLDKVLAVFYEALRMYPPAYVIVREAAEDTVLAISKPVEQDGVFSVPIPKGTYVIVDWIGVNYNPRYFEDPHKFKPSRWYDQSSHELMAAFSIGPRACIGRAFSTVENVCFLTCLLRGYRVEPLLQMGENLEGWRRRVFDPDLKMTLRLKPASLRFTARSRASNS